MKKEKISKKFLQSYLYTDTHGNFFVSTIYRQSSAMLAPDNWYFETFAWKLNDKDKREDSIIADFSGAVSERRAFEQHNEVLRQLNDTGIFNENL